MRDCLKNFHYQIIRSDRKSLVIQLKSDGSFIVKAPLNMTETKIEDFLCKKIDWMYKAQDKAKERSEFVERAGGTLSREEIRELAAKALIKISERVEYYAPIVGVTYGKITIRNQRSKWGSCSSKGNLNFNCLLMLAPPEVLDSVVVHELCHRKEMNHSNRFYAEVLRVFPDYWKCNQWLKENGRTLMAMMPENN